MGETWKHTKRIDSIQRKSAFSVGRDVLPAPHLPVLLLTWHSLRLKLHFWSRCDGPVVFERNCLTGFSICPYCWSGQHVLCPVVDVLWLDVTLMLPLLPGAGVFLLASAEGEQISFLFDCIVRGISPTRGPFGLRPILPGGCPAMTYLSTGVVGYTQFRICVRMAVPCLWLPPNFSQLNNPHEWFISSCEAVTLPKCLTMKMRWGRHPCYLAADANGDRGDKFSGGLSIV